MSAATKLTVTEDGFVYNALDYTISIICAKKKIRKGIEYSYSVGIGEDGKRIGQIITSRKHPLKEDQKRDKSIREILVLRAGLEKGDAKKVFDGLVDAFSELPIEELEKLITFPENKTAKKQQHSAIELIDLVGEAFEGISVFNELVICFNKGIMYEHKIPRQNTKSGS